LEARQKLHPSAQQLNPVIAVMENATDIPAETAPAEVEAGESAKRQLANPRSSTVVKDMTPQQLSGFDAPVVLQSRNIQSTNLIATATTRGAV
jgi:hypothetical protein